MQSTHILTDTTLHYIAQEVRNEGGYENEHQMLMAAMKRVRENYERVFYWNEARLFKRIAELELQLVKQAAPDAARGDE